MIPIGTNIHLWRLSRNLTQAELAAQAELTRPQLSGLEMGTRDMTVQTLCRLAKALSLTPGVLVDGIPPYHELVPSDLSRSEMERLAHQVAIEQIPLNEKERLIGGWLQEIMHGLRNVHGQKKGAPRRQSRSSSQAWLMLKAHLNPATLQSLIQRVEEHIHRESKAN